MSNPGVSIFLSSHHRSDPGSWEDPISFFDSLSRLAGSANRDPSWAGRWDVIVVGSGFGGSVAALRMVEKGYRVLLLEKGRRLRPQDLPRTNWDLPRWMWRPGLGFNGPFRMTFLRHLTALSGVGFGGGSIVYGNVLAGPPQGFYRSPSWARLAEWEEELAPYYDRARRMLGAETYNRRTPPDELLADLSGEIGRRDALEPAQVGVFLGEPGVTVPDPYFQGSGPSRTGCTHCGGCMVGCRFNAKNTLDLNYLHLAEAQGLEVHTETEVTAVRPLGGSAAGGYEVEALDGIPGPLVRRRVRRFQASRVILSAGVLGTVPLLLKMRVDPGGLPELSPRAGQYLRTNSEVLMGVLDRTRNMSDGVAITSLLRLDEASSLEPVRFSAGSGFFRVLMAPHAPGASLPHRLVALLSSTLRRLRASLEALTVPDFGKHCLILLYMRTTDGHLRLVLDRRGRGVRTEIDEGIPPKAAHPEATALGRRLESMTGGFLGSLLTETFLGIPTTAHLLGGCVMGESPETGVIGPDHQVWNYPGLYVMDGSAVSANPGVNPSLTIAALAERATDRMG